MVSPLAQALTFQQPMIPAAKPTVGQTDVVGAYRDAQNAAMMKYQAQLQQQNAMWGGLAGLGGAGILSLPRLLALKNGTTAAGALPDATATAADAATAGSPEVASLAPTIFSDPALASAATSAFAPTTTAAADSLVPATMETADIAAPVAADAAAGFSLADLLPFLALA